MKKFLTLFVLVCPLLALAQQTRQITGQVLDRADGAPLVGATVFIAPEETQAKDYNPQGTIAYEQGRFAFKLPASVRKVVVSYLGYEARTLDISGKSDFTIYLSASDNKVDAVVVTGYQRIEKRKLTSSISSVKMSDIARDGVASVDEMLSGSIAGLVSTPHLGRTGRGQQDQDPKHRDAERQHRPAVGARRHAARRQRHSEGLVVEGERRQPLQHVDRGTQPVGHRGHHRTERRRRDGHLRRPRGERRHHHHHQERPPQPGDARQRLGIAVRDRPSRPLAPQPDERLAEGRSGAGAGGRTPGSTTCRAWAA